MTNNAFAQEVLQTELELVRLHQKVAQLQKMKRNEIEGLLEMISKARDRCDRFLECYTGPERRRVAGLKDSFDQIYERVTRPLLEGIESEATTVGLAGQNDEVQTSPLIVTPPPPDPAPPPVSFSLTEVSAMQDNQTTDKPYSDDTPAVVGTPGENEATSTRPILSSATVSEIVTSMQEVQNHGSGQRQETQPEEVVRHSVTLRGTQAEEVSQSGTVQSTPSQATAVAPWPWESSGSRSKTEHSSGHFETRRGERGEASFADSSLLAEEESTDLNLGPDGFRDRLLRWYKLRRFVILEVAVAGILWIAIFFLLAALAPETIRGLVDWIAH